MTAKTITPVTLTRSFDNLRFTSRFSRPSANCLVSAGVAPITLVVGGGRFTHKSDFESRTPAALHRYTGATEPDSNSGSVALLMLARF